MSKEKINYYDEFIKNTDYALKSAEILDDYFENFEEEKAQEKEDVIHELENKADDSLHEIVKSLTKDFIPPLDRDDILEIGNYIDDMNDCIYDVIKNINTEECNDFQKNIATIFFYILYLIYLTFSALQIKYGFYDLRRANVFKNCKSKNEYI